MKISLNWLNEFIDLSGIDIKDIAARFSLTTAETEGYQLKKPLIKGAVAGEIKTCEKVRDSKKLTKLTIFDGRSDLQVICGAPNVRVGMKVVYADVGTKTIAGVESCGMCLGADELGFSNEHWDIIELDDAVKAGTDIIKLFPDLEDTIIEIDNKSITNRPDLWGHYGIARELAVIFNRPLKPLETADLNRYSHLPEIPVTIENKNDCLSYGAIRVDNISCIKTPFFMQIRLFNLGINPHGFVVDLTNYVMLEIGQPNHAFDADKIGRISIGNLPKGGKFITLKNNELTTAENMLFIKSDGAPVALAGVIGGQNSQIDETTRGCVFEFATFDAACVRKTASVIGTRTDASTRYEKSLDTNLNAVAAARTVYLAQKYNKAAAVSSCFSRSVSKETTCKKLEVEKRYAESFCGVKFNWADVAVKLRGLGFYVTDNKDKLCVVVPTWRSTKDISCEADIIEEIIRTYGYDKIVPVPPVFSVKPVKQPAKHRLVKQIKDLLCYKYGCNEVHTYIWSETPSSLRIVNSCVKGCDWILENLAPSLLSVFAKNRAQFDNVRIFEIGQVYDGKLVEQKRLAVCIQDYKELADIIRGLFGAKFRLGGASKKFLHPKNNAVIEVGGKEVGYIGVVPDKNTAVAEVCLDLPDLDGAAVKAKPISRYQKNTLDFTFETDKVYGEVEATFEKFSHPLNMGFKLKDVYNKSYTLQFTVGSYKRTLTAEDINGIWSEIIAFGRKAGFSLKE
jgi:phenylalanyl-tRNA synthetase beta chain